MIRTFANDLFHVTDNIIYKNCIQEKLQRFCRALQTSLSEMAYNCKKISNSISVSDGKDVQLKE